MRTVRLLLIGTTMVGALFASVAALAVPRHVYNNGRCGGERVRWARQGTEYGELTTRNSLGVGPHNITWNGYPISKSELRHFLSLMDKLNPAPNLQVVFDGRTDCRNVEEFRKLVAENVHCGHLKVCVEYSAIEWKRRPLRPIR